MFEEVFNTTGSNHRTDHVNEDEDHNGGHQGNQDNEEEDDEINPGPRSNTKNGGGDRKIPLLIPIGGTVAALLFIGGAVAVGCLCKTKRAKRSNSVHRTDENHIYGTYSRGWDGEGDYGEGDQVYVTDTNDYYYSNV